MKPVLVKLDDDYIEYLEKECEKKSFGMGYGQFMNRSEYIRKLIYEDAEKNGVRLGSFNARGRNGIYHNY